MKKLFQVFCVILFSLIQLNAQHLTSPKEHFGFNIGDNYHLATFTQTEAYLKKIATESNKVKLVQIGKTEEGRNHYMMIVSDPSNIKNLSKYKSISQRLARAEDLSEEQANVLSKEGKAVVWIDGGLHATEVVGIHQWIETLYQIISRNDEETKNILKNTIILFVHANPDGQELVSNWYMRHSDTLKRSTSQVPVLYQKYIGHDNNRDFFMMNMSESKNIARQQYIEWMPQILYNHHQTGPPGTVVAGPPYRDPFNYVYSPTLVTGIDALGAAMSTRLNAEGKPGYTMKGGSVYSTWWNGGLRTTAYYHNIIGLLTEIIGNPTPMNIPMLANRQIPNSGLPFPIAPQKWFFKNSIDYSISLNYAVLDYATRHKDELLFNIYRMGKESIQAGNKDNWTLSPKKAALLEDAIKAEKGDMKKDSVVYAVYNKVYKNPVLRDPRGYIVTSNQSNTAFDFINILIGSGIRVEKATNAFTVNNKNYPAGSFIVKTNQAFRPHVLDMFEPQDHPNDFLYPGGPPVRPYDAAGWTPAFTMGIQFDRILDDFNGPFETIPYGQIQKPIGTINKATTATAYSVSSKENDAFILINQLLKEKQEVFKTKDAFFIPKNDKTTTIINTVVKEEGIQISEVASIDNFAKKISALRIGLWDKYGGSMPSGWIRWILEKKQFDFSLIYAQEIDKGNLNDKYDVIVFVGGAIPNLTGESGNGWDEKDPEAADIPTKYQITLGKITSEKSIPSLKSFLENGGNVVTIGSSANLAYHLHLPVKNYLVEMNNGKERALPGEKFYIPGSIMEMSVDNDDPAAWGMNNKVDVYFDNSPVFKVAPEAIAKNEITPLGWYATATTLRSGWAYGQAYLQDGVAAYKAKVGKGYLYVMGPEITFRGQTHSAYKLLFNQLYK